MRRTVATVLTALVATLPLVTGALPANADAVKVDDPSGDVSDGRYRGGDYDQDAADIIDTRLDHQAQRVAFRIGVVEVMGVGGAPMTAEGRLRLPGGTERWLVLRTDGRGTKTVTLEDEAREPLPCEGLAGSIRPSTDRVFLSAPRECLQDPEWVRFGAGMTVSWGQVSSRDDARRPTSFSLPQQFKRRIGPEKVRPDAAVD